MGGPSVQGMKQSISVSAVAQWGRGAGEHGLAQPWSCGGPQSLPQSHLLSNGATEGQDWYLRHPFILGEAPAEALADSPPTFWG